MIETNIRVIRPGKQLVMSVRKAEVKGTNLSIDLIERACGRMRYQHGLASVPVQGDLQHLLVLTQSSIPTIRMEDEDWELEIFDKGEQTQILHLSDPTESKYMTLLAERALMANLARNTSLQTLDSPRIWYESRPFKVSNGISVYQRYHVAAIQLMNEGIGIAVDIGTAFFSEHSLDYFFDSNVDEIEQSNREKLFQQFTNRQAGQKGTLLYDNSLSKIKCYFEAAPPGITCSTTGKFRVKGKTYESVFDYYKEVYPKLKISPDAPAIRVSFRGIAKPQWVAAERVVVRIMNNSVPKSLNNIDKLEPKERREQIEKFWDLLGESPLGKGMPELITGFWKPKTEHVLHLSIPHLGFGKGRILSTPISSAKAFQDNYKKRLELLNECGCYYVPPDMPRNIYFAYPNTLDKKACEQLAIDLTNTIKKWTTYPVKAVNPIGYDHVSDAIETLKKDLDGVVVFILNKEPIAYHEVSFQLEDWRIKRITEGELNTHYNLWKRGAWNKQRKQFDLERGRRRWRDFVNLNTLGILQLLDVVPYRFERSGKYDAQLFIDVGHDRRHFALSLLIARDKSEKPNFSIVSDVQVKTDHQHEAINPKILSDEIVKLFDKVLHHRSTPLRNILVLRDGKFCGAETKAVDDAIMKLTNCGKINSESLLDLVDFRKDSLKSVRLWELTDANTVTNPLDGTAIKLNTHIVVVASTGIATLHQGTSQPFVIVANGNSDPVDAALAAFIGTQLNWSSPTVAQKLPLYAKRIDEDLKARSDQEIKRFS